MAEIYFYKYHTNKHSCLIYRDENDSIVVQTADIVSAGNWQLVMPARTVTINGGVVTFSVGRVTTPGQYVHVDDNNYMRPVKIHKIV